MCHILMAMADLMQELPYVPRAKYDPEWQCMAGTRKEIIAATVEWASTPGEAKVYWLSGQAGRGKTTIATSIACALSKAGSLGGTFFFRRDDEERRKPDKVFSSIAYQMSIANELFRVQLYAVLSKDRHAGKYGLLDQFTKLIQEPFRTIKDIQCPVVIILDALDEYGTTNDERKSFLHIIRDGIEYLPNFVKILITSRPDPDIKAAFRDMGRSVVNYDLDKHDDALDLVSCDIMQFFTVKLGDVALSHDLAFDWPGTQSREALVQRAMGLFQWAKVACDVIKDDDSDGPDAQLKSILEEPTFPASPKSSAPAISSPWAALDILYLQVLCQAATASSSRLPQLRDILAVIALAQTPLSALTLGALLGINAQTVQHRLRKLHSVVNVPNTSQDDLRIIHPSFIDFLIDRSRCAHDELYIDPMLHHGYLAKRCFLQLQCEKGDSCRLTNGRRITSDVVEELEHVTCQTEDIVYACQFWAVHVSLSSHDNMELHRLVREFLSHNFLHFICVLHPLTSLQSILQAAGWALVMFSLHIP